MKILLTGANGTLSFALKAALAEHELICMGKNELDVTDRDQILATMMKLNPDVVINGAAYTAVDDAEDDEDLAFKINAIGPQYLAEACSTNDVYLIHFSTDYVFDGQNSNGYKENDAKNPLSVYGKSKSIGEDLIMDHCSDYAIIRTSWLFGPNGKNFVDTMLNLAKDKDELSIVSDQIGCPTYTVDLANAVAELVKKPQTGVFHIVNSTALSWFDFAKLIFELSNIQINLKPILAKDFGRKAARPQYSTLINTKLPQLRPLEDALKDYLKV